MRKIGKFIFLLLLFIVPWANAQVAVQAELLSDKIGVGQTVNLELKISSQGDVSIDPPGAPQVEGMAVLNSSQSTQISTRMQPGENGMEYNTQKTTTFTYRLKAVTAGKKVIKPFHVVVNGKDYKTESLSLDVSTKAVAQPHEDPMERLFNDDDDPFAQMNRMEEELFNQMLRRRGGGAPSAPGGNSQPAEDMQNPALFKEPAYRSEPTNPNEAFFIQVEVDKTEVYEGEQILVSWYLLTRGQLESLDRTKFPDLKGFWKEIIEEVPAIQFYQEVINGVGYKKALLARHALFPLKAGNTVIDEFKIKSKVRLPNQNFGFNLGKVYEYTKSSQRVKIKVNPLPLEGRPASFSGAVGKFKVTSQLEGSQPMAHQPMKFKLKIEGFGNAKGIELPSISWPEGIEVFEVRNETKFFKNGQSFKEFEIILIPRNEGKMVLPAVEMSYFNPETKKYETERSIEIPIDVLPGDKTKSTESFKTNENKPIVKESPVTLPSVITDVESYQRSPFQNKMILWFVIFGAILAVMVGYAVVSFGWRHGGRDIKKELNHKIAKAEKRLQQKMEKETFIEVTNIFYFVLGELAGEGGGSMEIRKLLDKMPTDIRRNYEKDILNLFEFFQTLSFAPDELVANLKNPKDIKENFEKMKVVLNKCLEK
ncbi:MAG: protein BatD [Bdellovibrionaceae bacterium]|nr:protein BatD [Pseudobdellovibrionaceae bacterium]